MGILLRYLVQEDNLIGKKKNYSLQNVQYIQIILIDNLKSQYMDDSRHWYNDPKANKKGKWDKEEHNGPTA